MMDQFLINAIIGGISIAAIAGLLGSFVLWKNMSYFGDALSHSSLLGVTIGILLNINLTIAVIAISAIFALIFSINKVKYSSDSILGILSYSALSLAVIIASYSKISIDLMSYLFGDILAINAEDIYYLILCAIFISSWFYYNWSKLILLCVSSELLNSEGGNVQALKLGFSLILALFIAISFKIVGIFLITAMLIIPASSALVISRSPFQMVINSIIIGCFSIIIGMGLAISLDFPTGPAIIISSLGMFIVINLFRMIKAL
jgi:zinc transport system permease protein